MLRRSLHDVPAFTARAIINKGQITQTVVQFVYAPPTDVKELRSLQVRAAGSAERQCACGHAPAVTRQLQLLTRLHTDAGRCGLNLAYFTHP